MDYLHLLDKINKNKLAVNMSIRMKHAWADPNSYYNSQEFTDARVLAMKLAWEDPNSKFNTQEFRDKKSNQFKAMRDDPIYKARRIAQFLISNSDNAKKGVENQTRYKNYPMYYKDPESTHERMSIAQKKTAKARWKKRVDLYGSTGVKNPELTNKRKKEAWAWRKCALVLKMIFSDNIIKSKRFGISNRKHWAGLSEKERKRRGEAMKRGWAWRRVSAMFAMIYGSI